MVPPQQGIPKMQGGSFFRAETKRARASSLSFSDRGWNQSGRRVLLCVPPAEGSSHEWKITAHPRAPSLRSADVQVTQAQVSS